MRLAPWGKEIHSDGSEAILKALTPSEPQKKLQMLESEIYRTIFGRLHRPRGPVDITLDFSNCFCFEIRPHDFSQRSDDED